MLKISKFRDQHHAVVCSLSSFTTSLMITAQPEISPCYRTTLERNTINKIHSKESQNNNSISDSEKE